MRVSEIVIIESLEDHEFKTGQELAGYLQALDATNPTGIRIRFISCTHSAECVEHIRALADESARGLLRPVLHFECHGSEADGLVFSNGSELSWRALGDELRHLNAACGINLVVFLNACHGAHFIEDMDTTRPAPCMVLVGPAQKVDPGEVQASYRSFYRTLFETADLGMADSALKRVVRDADWQITHAEQWFDQVTQGYILEHCSRNAMRQRAEELYRRAQGDGRSTTMGEFKRLIRERNREWLINGAFDRFFMLDRFPQNRLRFSKARARLSAKLERLRKTKRYGL